MDDVKRVIDAHLEAATNLALKEIEARVRKALKRSPKLSFCLAMGSAGFYWDGEPLEYEDRSYFKPALDLINEYDRYLKLTGCPMRIDAWDAPTKTDW
jgi:hypothetical protein